jgi:HAMP domain-containing protein
MKWFLDLTVRAKLLLAFGLMLLLLASVMVTAYTGIRAIVASQKALYEQEFTTAVDLKEVRYNQMAMRVSLLIMMLLADRTKQGALDQEIKERGKRNDETMQRLLEGGRDDRKRLAKLEEFETIRAAWKQTREAQVIPLIYEGKSEEAKKLMLGIQAEHQGKMQAIADALVDEADATTRAAVLQSEQRAQETVRVTGMVGVLALLLGVTMALFLTRILAYPLREISGVAERVASGDLTANMTLNPRADEVGHPGAELPPVGGESAGCDGRDRGGRQCAGLLRQ